MAIPIEPPRIPPKINTEEEISKLWDAHFEVLCYLDEHITAIKNLAEALKDVATEIDHKTQRYEFKQIYKELEELQGKLEYTFSKVQELKQKSTPKGKYKKYIS